MKDTADLSNDRIHFDQVENALHEIQSTILSHESFCIRPKILDVRMFDEFTTSNAEAEHASLKKKSLGVVATQKMTTLYEKTDMNATQKTQLRVIQQHKDFESTNVLTQCSLSNYVVKPCYNELVKRLEYASKTVSKQINSSHWIVIYDRRKLENAHHDYHFLPNVHRKRHVKLSTGEFQIFLNITET